VSTLKVFYEPIRKRIIDRLRQPMSVTELGEALGESPNRLYYHVRLLEKHGLITVATERRVGNNIERLYGRAASRYEISPELGAEGAVLARPSTASWVTEMFNQYVEWLTASLDRPPGGDTPSLDPAVQQLIGRISRERAQEMRDRLTAVALEYLGADAATDEDGVRLTTLVIVTPIPE
jgi:DNA-binding transcriptional ArsR family regulator